MQEFSPVYLMPAYLKVGLDDFRALVLNGIVHSNVALCGGLTPAVEQ